MTRHDDPSSLRHMLDYVSEVVGMAAGRWRDDVKRDRMLDLALVRLVELETLITLATRAGIYVSLKTAA